MPKIIDLYCGGGGAGVGYHNAGFEVVGLDKEEQPYYPFSYFKMDVFDLHPEWFRELGFDAVHASPPCQAHTRLRNTTKRTYPDLIPATRRLLRATGLPYVIENVPGANLINPILLCGDMFGLKIRRHRLFESNIYLVPPIDLCARGDVYAGWKLSFIDSAHSEYRDAMEVDWMSVEASRQAIPPAYTEWIGGRLLEVLRSNADVVE